MLRRIKSRVLIGISALLCATVIWCNPVMASVPTPSEYPNYSESKEARIDALIEQLVEIRITANDQQNLFNSSPQLDYTAQEDQILDELESLGDRIISPQEVARLSNHPQSRFDPPPESNNVEWHVSGPSRYSYGGQSYYTVTLRGAAKNTDSVLSQGVYISVREQEITETFCYELLNVYVQKAIGSIPVFAWTPYELFGFSDKRVLQTESDYNVLARETTTPKYIYVASGDSDPQDDYSFQLSLLTHSSSLADTHVLDYVLDGQSKQNTRTRNKTLTSDYYSAPMTQAIRNFDANYYEIISPGTLIYTFGDIEIEAIDMPEGTYLPESL